MEPMYTYGIIALVMFLIWIFYVLTREKVEDKVRRMQEVVYEGIYDG